VRAPRILFLEPFFGGSHRAFARGLVRHSRCRIDLATLPARNWKWRVRASGIVFATRLAHRLGRYDLLVASSLQDVSSFLTFARAGLGARSASRRAVSRPVTIPPVILYMHESQLAYPIARGVPLTRETSDERQDRGPLPKRLAGVTPAAGGPKRDWGLLFADLASAAAAECVLFNSRHHRDEFFRGVTDLLALVPDAAPRGVHSLLRRRSRIVYPGVELSDIAEPAPASRPARGTRGDPHSPALEASLGPAASPAPAASPDAAFPPDAAPGPLILWNHRWEFDKNPVEFFAALRAVVERGGRFRLALLGESARIVPKPFLAAREWFGAELVHYGRVPTRREYARWLAKADIVVSTSEHENFGLSWIEAMAAGAWPLLPRRVAYPELLPRRFHADHLYDGREDLVRRLMDLCADPRRLTTARSARAAAARRYDWLKRIGEFDRIFGEMAASRLRKPR